MKSKLILVCLTALIPVVASAPALAQTAEKVTAVIPQNSVFILNWNGAKDAGVFAKHGIDLTVDARPFAGFLAAVPAKEALATTYSGIDAISKMNEGLDLAIIGGGLTVIQEIFVPKDSPIKTVADLRGKRLGVWSTGAGAFKAARAASMPPGGQGHQDHATGAAGVVQAVGKGRRRRHDQYQLVHRSSGRAAG